MNTIHKTNEALAPVKHALKATEVVANLAKLEGWRLAGDGAAVAIEKTFTFANYHETISFVNAVAFIAHRQNHHPDLSVHFQRCVVRFRTHDVGGLSMADFDCAARVDALLA
ncbi:4a-hydroxytetrahydrobiopterin dehydratase [Rhodoferax ferrireducens]|uniref:4a-hydroxytetrahydrobiopterin dehydratase n=1 Tax=Rhodoferax ferrireducens TaxID=192843 RepID=UPI00298EA243|nr:4a-hydroxytetrahydrobiopterin dehydratase [Rhodoferax ferrireducens]WPC68251.1 4a-hydroxytetrahydrobiopterin dehydratase [Rhodoferax ferrireducens]